MAGRIFILLFLGTFFASYAGSRDSVYTIINGEKVYKRVQFKPEYPGGTDSLLAFLDRNLVLPSGAGGTTVTAVFIVDSNGKMTDIHIQDSSDPRYSIEAGRVLSLMPHWKPAVHLGKKVSCFFTMPITFEQKTKK